LAAGFAAAFFAAGFAAGLAAAAAFFFAAINSHLPSMPGWQNRKKCSSGILWHCLVATCDPGGLSGSRCCAVGGSFPQSARSVLKVKLSLIRDRKSLAPRSSCTGSLPRAHHDFQSFPRATVHGLIL
jgi:hypothetical protein